MKYDIKDIIDSVLFIKKKEFYINLLDILFSSIVLQLNCTDETESAKGFISLFDSEYDKFKIATKEKNINHVSNIAPIANIIDLDRDILNGLSDYSYKENGSKILERFTKLILDSEILEIEDKLLFWLSNIGNVDIGNWRQMNIYKFLNQDIFLKWFKCADIMIELNSYVKKRYLIYEFKSRFLFRSSLCYFNESKILYKLDRLFLDSMLNTEISIKDISAPMLEHLPCSGFMIFGNYDNNNDFAFSIMIKKMDSEFVESNILNRNPNHQLDQVPYLVSIGSFWDDNDIGSKIFWSTIIFAGQDQDSFEIDLEGNYYNIDDNMLDIDPKKLLLSFISYLSTEKPDVDTDNPEIIYKEKTGKKYQYKSIKVGFKYHKSVKEKYLKNNNEKIIYTGSSNNKKIQKPYFRIGHWHHYWCGKGRTRYEVRWIKPVLVGNPLYYDYLIYDETQINKTGE